MREWLPYALTIAGSVAASWITFRLRFESFMGKDGQREKDWIEWRGRFEERVGEIDTSLRAHEKYCTERWNSHLKDYGEIVGRMKRYDER